ncbi:MAG TPA: HEAT repeat domain-containing protein [Bryobacteraceae bacterium]|nr:HEAT repeat domain-containing protein [Bryobacteraceae bacterium]
MTTIELSIAVVLFGFFGLMMFGLFLAAMVRALVSRWRSNTSAGIQPDIRRAVVDYLGGTDNLRALQSLTRNHHRHVTEVMLGFQGKLSTRALDRLGELALKLGLVDDWLRDARSLDIEQRRNAFARLAFVSVHEPCHRITGELLFKGLSNSDDPEIWLCASRAVIQSGTGEQIEAVFDLAIRESLLIRILLTEDLRRHAVPLCEHAVPDALRSRNPRRVLAALDMLVAWECGIVIDVFRDLLEHRNKDIRIQALRLAPYIPLLPENRAAIVNALADPDPEISTAAALSAAQQHIAEALPLLARMLRIAPADLARTAAAALAEIPPRGWQALEEFSGSPNPVTASVAACALGHARRRVGL